MFGISEKIKLPDKIDPKTGKMVYRFFPVNSLGIMEAHSYWLLRFNERQLKEIERSDVIDEFAEKTGEFMLSIDYVIGKHKLNSKQTHEINNVFNHWREFLENHSLMKFIK